MQVSRVTYHQPALSLVSSQWMSPTPFLVEKPLPSTDRWGAREPHDSGLHLPALCLALTRLCSYRSYSKLPVFCSLIEQGAARALGWELLGVCVAGGILTVTPAT